MTKRVRREVLHRVDKARKQLPQGQKGDVADVYKAYRVRVTRLEALQGSGERDRLATESGQLFATASEAWIPQTTKDQLEELR